MFKAADMKKSFIFLFFLILAFELKGQDAAGTTSTVNKDPKSKKSKRVVSQQKIHYGTASFYANKFEGRKTANGEVFSQKKLTGASNILPLNQWVRVTNMRNNLAVVL